MKKKKGIFLLNKLLCGLFVFMVVSCTSKKDPVTIANEHNTAKFNEEEKISSSHFFVDAAEILLQEMQLSKMAQNNSIKKDVIRIAEIIEIEYNQSYYLLKAIADKKSITIPSELSNGESSIYKKLSYEIADDFDKQYFDMAEKDHNDAIDLFEKIKNESNDEDIKTWAVNLLPRVKDNLDSILVLHQRVLKPKHFNSQIKL